MTLLKAKRQTQSRMIIVRTGRASGKGFVVKRADSEEFRVVENVMLDAMIWRYLA